MNFTITSAAGEILRTGTCPDQHAQWQVQPGETLHQEHHDRATEYFSPEFEQWMLKGEPPAAHYVWQQASRTWIDPRSLAERVSDAVQRIDAERVRRTNEPIAYAGARLDADATAQDNLKAKLAEVGQRRRLEMPMPPELLVWRDADNVTHTFPDIDTYADWLGGLVIAISQRGTEAYAWSWQQKALLAQAEQFGDLPEIDAIPRPSGATHPEEL